MNKRHFIAIDCGQSGGKAVDFAFDGERLSVENSIPFFFEPVNLLGSLYFDVVGMYGSMVSALSEFVKIDPKGSIASVGVTTWGGGYAFFDEDGRMLGNSISHRDAGVCAAADDFLKLMSERDYYFNTGTPFAYYVGPNMLLYDKLNTRAYESAAFMLATPSIFNYFLSGAAIMDDTIGSALSFLKLRERRWNTEFLDSLGLRSDLLTELVKPATPLGKINPSLAAELGDGGISVVCVPGHDTAACMPAIPLMDDETVFISMGTMMLAGIETDEPLCSEDMYAYKFRTVTSPSEKYISYGDNQGFWILNRCVADFKDRGLTSDFGALEKKAASLPAGRSIINTNDPLFYLGDSPMPARVREFCKRTNQRVPENEFEVYRCLNDSYVVNAMRAVDGFERAAGRKFKRVSLVNGGSQSALLCEEISRALGLLVNYGVRYASAAGNVLSQLQGMGEVSSLAEMRQLAERSFGMKTADFKKQALWDELYARAMTF